MKLTTKILSIILCCILLFGCSDGDQSIDGFKLVYDGSDYYAVVMCQEAVNDNVKNNFHVILSVGFQSMDEMYDKITTGNFTHQELYNIYSFPTNGQGLTPIMDMDHLVEPVFPAGMTQDCKVYWRSDNYSFDKTIVDSEGSIHIDIYLTNTKDSVDVKNRNEVLAQWDKNFMLAKLENDYGRCLKYANEDPATNAVIYTIHTEKMYNDKTYDIIEYKLFTIGEGDNTTYVKEKRYCYSAGYIVGAAQKNAIYHQVEIYGMDCGVPFEVSIFFRNGRTTLPNWDYTEFALKEYDPQ